MEQLQGLQVNPGEGCPGEGRQELMVHRDLCAKAPSSSGTEEGTTSSQHKPVHLVVLVSKQGFSAAQCDARCSCHSPRPGPTNCNECRDSWLPKVLIISEVEGRLHHVLGCQTQVTLQKSGKENVRTRR